MGDTTKVKPSNTYQKAMDQFDASARSVLTRAGDYLAGRMRARLQRDGKSASGSLAKSIEVSTAEKTPDGWKVRVGPKAAHATYVVHGRRAGAKMPPVRAIENWIFQKGLSVKIKDSQSAEQAVRSAAWAIARSIAKYGIDPYPFVGQTYREEKATIKVMLKQGMKIALQSAKKSVTRKNEA